MKQALGWSEQTWLYLDQFGILMGDIMLLVSIGVGAVGWLRRDTIRNWFSKNRFPNIGGSPEDLNWQGLIFTVSKEHLPCWVIEQIRPERIGLLVTEQSAEAGKRIQQQAERMGIQVYRRLIDNPDDPHEAYSSARALLEQMRDGGEGRYAIDLTGGKVTMSIGAFMAAEESGIDSLYVSTEFNNGRPDMRTAHIISVSQGG